MGIGDRGDAVRVRRGGWWITKACFRSRPRAFSLLLDSASGSYFDYSFFLLHPPLAFSFIPGTSLAFVSPHGSSPFRFSSFVGGEFIRVFNPTLMIAAACVHRRNANTSSIYNRVQLADLDPFPFVFAIVAHTCSDLDRRSAAAKRCES